MARKIYKDAEYPIYEILIDDSDKTGIKLVSLVENPAIEINGMAFSKDADIQQYDFKNIEEKQMIVGPALIPNKKIIRKDENGDPYYVFFTEDTIKKMVAKFNKDNNNKSINVDHTNTMVKSAYIQQNWIVEDEYYDKSKMYGFELPIGSWFIEVKVDNKDEWMEYVKMGNRYSFSVQGFMGQRLVEYSFNDIIDDLSDDEINDILKNVN